MSLSILLSPLQTFLKYLQAERFQNDSRKDEALHAIYEALIETKKYVELSDGIEDREQEYELSKLWADASVKARRVSQELGMVMKGKSEYWSDSFEWSREEVLEKSIDFESIENQISQLLGDS